MKNFKKLLREHRRAFTLAEVVIVMAILSIMMVAFAPVMTKKANTSTDSFRTFQRTAGNHGVSYGTRTDSKPVVIGDNELRYGANYQPRLVVAATTVGNGASTRLTPHISFLAENRNNNVKFATGQLIVSGGYISSGDVGTDPEIPASVAMKNLDYLRHLMPIAFATAQNKETITPAVVNPTLPGGGGGTGNYWSSEVLLSRGVSVILGGNPDANYAFDVGGDRMTVVGGFACSGATNGVDGLTCFGSETGRDAELAANTVFVGREAGRSATSLNGGIYIGNQAGMSSTIPASGNPVSSIFIGQQAGSSASNTSGTVFLGNQAGSSVSYTNNGVFIGNQAGSGADTADRSIYIGHLAGASSDAADDGYAIFIGREAGNSLPDADHAVIIGNEAASGDAGGASFSVVIGDAAGYAMTETSNSVLIGKAAGKQNERSTDYSVMIGSYAGSGSGGTDGAVLSYGVAIGYKAGKSSTDVNAQDSVIIGHSALSSAQSAVVIGGKTQESTPSSTYASGQNAVALGAGASATANNVVAIGYKAGSGYTQAANNIYLGSGTVPSNGFYIGNKKMKEWMCTAWGGTYDAGGGGMFNNSPEHCHIAAGGFLSIGDSGNIQLALLTGNDSEIPSDERLKNVGKPFKDGLELIEKIMPVNFTYKRDENKIQHVGVIAQDLMKIIPNAVNSNKDGFLYIRTEDMFYAAINAIKELHQMFLEHDKRIKQLEARNAVLEQQNKELMELYTELAKRVERLDNKKTKDIKFTPMPVFEEETEEEVKTEK